MIGRPFSNLYRIAVSALALSALSLIVLTGLAESGFLGVSAALIAGALILLATAFAVGRSVGDLRLIRAAIEDFGPDGEAVSRQVARSSPRRRASFGSR